MNIEAMLKDLGRVRREQAKTIQNRRRRAQLRESLRRTIHTAIWVFATIAAVVVLLSM